MKEPQRITYLFESTALWGGTKVALEQAEALSGAGYDVRILSKDSGPEWYPLTLPVAEVADFNASTIPESDIIVGTYWPTVKAACAAKKGMVVHLCQGYEGGYKELENLKPAIDEVYSYRVPKLTVSPHLDSFLRRRFGAETYYVGQMLNRDIFHPPADRGDDRDVPPYRILVTGPFEVDFKNVAFTLRGIALAREKHGLKLMLIRVSQFPLTGQEKAIIDPDVYRFHVPHFSMGEIYRTADLFVSMSKEAEGFGLPALEAMACGVPAVLSGISSYTSFGSPADYALFLEPSDPMALADAIAALSGDASLRKRLRERALAVADSFTKEKVLRRLTDALRAIASGKKE